MQLLDYLFDIVLPFSGVVVFKNLRLLLTLLFTPLLEVLIISKTSLHPNHILEVNRNAQTLLSANKMCYNQLFAIS